MKSSKYKNPVRSAIIINIFTLYMLIGSVLDNQYTYSILLIMLGVINKQIIDKGQNIDKRKKILIYFSFFLTIIIFFIFAMYMHNVKYT